MISVSSPKDLEEELVDVQKEAENAEHKINAQKSKDANIS